ncbi:MAG TPA: carbohydrate-binding family V/XII, partial [Rubrivivax sp.]|nr:carbohydrate-binding family V/XII [Rubrivivax sp.]
MSSAIARSACALCIALIAGLAPSQPAAAQPAAANAASANPSAGAWPRDVSIADAAVLVYQPQVNRWAGNRIELRLAAALKPAGATQETFGVIFADARTQVDKAARTVVLQDLELSRLDFPTLPDRGAAYAGALQASLARQMPILSLDRLEASLAAAGVKPAPVQVRNEPPQVVVRTTPAILVPVDGAPVWQPLPHDSRFQRVINTHALILKGGLGDQLYLHVYDGWLSAAVIDGPWTRSNLQPLGLDDAARKLAKSGVVDLLDGGPKANPKPSLGNGVPQIVVAQVPTELIVFKGRPDFEPIGGTQLLWASNTTADVFIATTDNQYYVLMSGRWFSAPGLDGPWRFVAADALPPDFARIPPASRAGAVLPTVAGTPQAQEAVISNSIPQTATVPLQGGPS